LDVFNLERGNPCPDLPLRCLITSIHIWESDKGSARPGRAEPLNLSQYKIAGVKLEWGQDCILRSAREHFCSSGAVFTTLPLTAAAKPLGYSIEQKKGSVTCFLKLGGKKTQNTCWHVLKHFSYITSLLFRRIQVRTKFDICEFFHLFMPAGRSATMT
jgi:hypothetical protein